MPRSTKDVRSFVGLCSYFRRFVKNFADVARPLTQLLKKDTSFSWGPEQATAFHTLTTLLTSPPILAHFDPSAHTELRTDASGHGIGAVLAQQQQGRDRVIAYASRLLSSSECKFSITERECLALVWAVGKFRPYLFGRTFSVITDHHALCWLSSLKDPTGRLGRWALKLQEYSFDVTYKSGRLHQDADCLSRHPVDPPDLSAHDSDACVCAVSDLSDIRSQQLSDANLRSIIHRLRSHHSPRPSNYSCFVTASYTDATPAPMAQSSCSLFPKHSVPLFSNSFMTPQPRDISEQLARTIAFGVDSSGQASTALCAATLLLVSPASATSIHPCRRPVLFSPSTFPVSRSTASALISSGHSQHL